MGKLPTRLPAVIVSGSRMKRRRVAEGSAQKAGSHYEQEKLRLPTSLPIVLLTVLVSSLVLLVFAQSELPAQLYSGSTADTTIKLEQPSSATTESVLPPVHLRPNVHVNIKDWTRRLSEDIGAVSNKTNCLQNIERFFENKAEFRLVDPTKLRDSILNQINTLLGQHRAAVNNIVAEAEKLVISHNFVKNLRFNYTDVHRLRNELEPINQDLSQSSQTSEQLFGSSGGQLASGQTPQFTSINGGTPVPGPVEWQTPVKSIVMQVNKNFGDIPVNTSMSAIHLPLPIYAGLPEIMNGIAWTERMDGVFKRNLANYMHVHHQYYGDHLGFMRTYPAHKWRIPRTDPDLFDARTRPWYVTGVSSAKDVVILVDTSGSMTGLRREIAKGVVFEILDTLTNNDHFAVMRFSETVTPVGLPSCRSLRPPKLAPELEEQCSVQPSRGNSAMLPECSRYRDMWDTRGQYLRDHPNVVLGKNGSYLTDDVYKKSVVNVTHEIADAFLLPATARNIRYLKSNFSMPTAGIANFTNALMAAFELLQAYRFTPDRGSQCSQTIMLITDGAIRSHDDIFNRYNYPNSPVRIFTYMIGREVGDITHTKAMACSNRGYYTHVINLSEVREQVQKYLPVMARPMVLYQKRPISWTYAYGDETHQVLTDWVLETKRRERARIMLNEERERMNEANSSDVINIELTNITEYDELPLVDEELKNRIICEDNNDDPVAMNQSLSDELDPLGYNDLACHWALRRADLLTSVVKPVFDNRNTTLYFQRILHKNIWTEQETHVRNAQLLGVAAVDLRIADIIRAAPSHLLGANGYVILVGANGFLLHHPDLRALLEDPFDKQSKILKPYFNAVDLSQVEQPHTKNDSDSHRRRNEEAKVLNMRASALRRQVGSDIITIKRAIECRKRPSIRQQVFYYGPIKDTPFSFILALPQSYGLNRLDAKLELNQKSLSHFLPSFLDLFTVHPEYRYCEGSSLSKENGSVSAILGLLEAASRGNASNIFYEDLTNLNGADDLLRARPDRIFCDKELFPSLLFDAAATYEKPDSFCGSNELCDDPSGGGSSFSYFAPSSDTSCARTPDQMRSKLASIYGLEMSFLATRSGLTRVKAFDLTARIKKLADLFIKRHNRAVDEPWYARTVEWNTRFHEEATIITAPYNAYIRLIAKLRQRITQRHPADNDTRANCDPMADDEEASGLGEEQQVAGAENGTISSEPSDIATPGGGAGIDPNVQNDEPLAASSSSSEAPQVVASATTAQRINYSQYSSFELLDLLTNSSVHIYATQSVIVNKGGPKQRTPVAVSGLLYDYATFARRFLNATSLNIRVDPSPVTTDSAINNPEGYAAAMKVDICPGGDCPTRCGDRNDSIDCLLVDNNGFIVVGEELAHIGRSLVDYDEKLMQSLVEKRVFQQVQITDFQAICTRNDQLDVVSASSNGKNGNGNGQYSNGNGNGQSLASVSQISSSALPLVSMSPSRWHQVAGSFLANLAGISSWLWTMLYSLVLFQTSSVDLGDLMQFQRSVIFADGQSAVANQSLLALLPNKTYLRPCERTQTLYESRAFDLSKLSSDAPEYYVTSCGCSGWYVYDAVPRTNLIMMIVNTTSACRRCDPSAVAAAASNLIPVPAPPPVSPAQQFTQSGIVQQELLNAPLVPNKTAEDQVCAMLEREAQLYVRRPDKDTCFSSHVDEAGIHICGAASKSAPISLTLLLSANLVALMLIMAHRLHVNLSAVEYIIPIEN